MAELNITSILNAAKKGIPYNYVVGSKTTSSGIPFDVRVSLDPELKTTITKAAAYTGAGFAIGIIGAAFLKYR